MLLPGVLLQADGGQPYHVPGGGHAHGHAGAQAGRSGPHGDHTVRDAIDKLDKQFLYLLSTIAGKQGIKVKNT